MRTCKTTSLLAALVMLFPAPAARACDVPVFRWALERWGATAPEECYELIVFHRGEFTAADKSVVDWLAKCDWRTEAPINLIVNTVDLDGDMDDDTRAVWDRQESAEPPWMVLRFPPVLQAPFDLWAGPLDATAAQRVVDTPVRREIARYILDGTSAVWVLVESGDREKDEAVAALLTRQLDTVAKEMELPVPAEDPVAPEPVEGYGPEVKIAFSVVRLSRNDPTERILLDTLLRSEPDLHSNSEPMVFPVIGRGRALFVLIGKGINENNITGACVYIVGACTCEVKFQNPGIDLLMLADWDALFTGRPAAVSGLLPMIAPAESDPAGTDPSGKAGGGAAAAEPSSAGDALSRNVLIAVAFMVIVAAVVVAIAVKRSGTEMR